MNDLPEILGRAKAQRHALTRDELAFLLTLTDPAERRALYAAAYEVKVRAVGKVVSLRGIIEMGNVCAKDCFYCGIRKGNAKVDRFQLDEEAVLRAAKRNLDQEYGSLVLQSGEIESEPHTALSSASFVELSSSRAERRALRYPLASSRRRPMHAGAPQVPTAISCALKPRVPSCTRSFIPPTTVSRAALIACASCGNATIRSGAVS